MKLKQFSVSKRYLWSIILWTGTAVLLVVLVLSSALYLNSQNILLKKEYESNRKVFEQARINIDMMDSMARNLCGYLYVNGDVGAIMYAREEDVVDATIRINRTVNTAVSANPYMHSVTIYNNYLKRFYNAGQSLFFDDREIIKLAEGKQKLKKLKLFSRKIEKLVNGKAIYVNVFSYFMYDTVGNTDEIECAIAVNVSTDWFLDNIRQINMIEKGQEDYAFVLDANGEFIDVEEESGEIKGWLKGEYRKHMEKEARDDVYGFFQSAHNGVDYLATYSYIGSIDATLFRVQRLPELYRSINNLKTSVIIITLVLLLFASLILTGISRRLYSPVGNLVKLVSSGKRQSMAKKELPNEIAYLSNFYKATMEKLDSYDRESYQQKDIMKQYWLKKLLEESHAIELHKAGEPFSKWEISLSPQERFLVCVLFIDNYKAFMREYGSKDRDLLKFATVSISSEVFDRKYKNEGIDMKDGQIAFIIGIRLEEEDYLEEIEMLIGEIQKYMKQYFQLSVSASLSRATEDIREIASLYNSAVDNAIYRLKQGHSCIISPKAAQSGYSGKKEDSKELELLLVEKIKAGNFREAEEALKKIFEEIALLEYDNILISLINTASVIRNTLDNGAYTHRPGKAPAGKHSRFDFNFICQCIMEKETLAEIYDVFAERVRDILEKEPERPIQSKESYIVDAVKEFIKKNYSDSNLSLTAISDVMNIPARRLSKIFKDETKRSVSECLNDARLDKAAELLSETFLNVNEVVAMVGIDNETYFYGMFKKKFGVTPKEFAFKRIKDMAGQ
jgi:AraC-like DNA-binding protein